MENENRNGIKKEEIKSWQDLAKFARVTHKLEFNKEKWKYEIPQCGAVNTNERAKWVEKWRPIIKQLNDILNNLK